MSGPKRAGVCMRRRPKEQVQQPQPDLDNDDLQHLSPVRTDTKKTAPKQKKVPQPRKPRVPAWQAEAIRMEAERARAHFKEVDEFELLEEVASPEPAKQLPRALTPQEDTENVPPRQLLQQHSPELDNLGYTQEGQDSQECKQVPGPACSEASITSAEFATPEAGIGSETPDGASGQHLKHSASAEPDPVQEEPSVGSAISELLKPSDLGTTPSISRLLRSPSNAVSSDSAHMQPSAAADDVALASNLRATPGESVTPSLPHNLPATPPMEPAATTAPPASHRTSDAGGVRTAEPVAKRSEQRLSSMSSARQNVRPSSFKSLSEQLSQLTPVITPAASPMPEQSHVASVAEDAPAEPVETPQADPEHSEKAASVSSSAVQAEPPAESLQNSESIQDRALSASSQCTDARHAVDQTPASKVHGQNSMSQKTGSSPQKTRNATQARALSAQAATPIPSRRQQKLLKAGVSMVLQDASVHPSGQDGTHRMSLASAFSGRTPGVQTQNLHTSHRRSTNVANNVVHPSPQPRTALLNSLLSRRSQWSIIEQGTQPAPVIDLTQPAPVIDLTQSTPQQTPPYLLDSVSDRSSMKGIRGSIAPRQSIMPDPSPIYEQSETSDRPSISSVGEIPAVATPVATSVPSTSTAGALSAANTIVKPAATPDACSGQSQDADAPPEAAARHTDSAQAPVASHKVESTYLTTSPHTADVVANVEHSATAGTAPLSRRSGAPHEHASPVPAGDVSSSSDSEASAAQPASPADDKGCLSAAVTTDAVPVGTASHAVATPAQSLASSAKSVGTDSQAVGTPTQAVATRAASDPSEPAASIPVPASGQAVTTDVSSKLQTDQSTYLSPASSASSEDTAIRQAASTDTATSSDIPAEPLTALEELLMLCNQSEPMAFKTAMNELTAGKKVEKLAEGSFKEVFLCGSDVIQVMPIEGTSLINDLEPMSADKVIPEITALAQLSRLHTPTPALNDPKGRTSCCAAFPNTKRVVVVSGKYHAPLLAAWKRFAVKWAHDEDKCQNESPGKLPASQLYIIMVVQNGGCDLEGFAIQDFKTAKNLLLQATLALAVAESCLEFEHRDLHWGNILVDTVPDNSRQVYCLRGQDWNLQGAGIKICLIDFTLSRLTGAHGTVKCADLATEDMSWLFTQVEEVVNPQTEAYCAMKQQAEKQWREEGLESQQGWHTFTPCTNVQWILYLAKILRYKKYKKHKAETYKGVSMTSKELSSWSAFMCVLSLFGGDVYSVSVYEGSGSCIRITMDSKL